MTAAETKKLNKKLNGFLVTAVSLMIMGVYLLFDNAGFKKEIRSEMKGFKNLFEQHIATEKEVRGDMKKLIEANRKNHIDIANQAIDKWGYKPTVRGIN